MPLLRHKLYGQEAEKVILFNDWMGDCSSWTPVLPYFDVERSGRYPMEETPVKLQTLMDGFLSKHVA